MSIPFYRPSAAPPAALNDALLPVKAAHPLSRLFFQWLGPFMKIGYSRPLQEQDLWALPDQLQCQIAADRVEAVFNARLPPSKRLEKYRDASPVKTGKRPDLSHDSGAEKIAGTGDTTSTDDTEETLRDEQHDIQAGVRAEVTEELALTLVDSHLSRRGSDSTNHVSRPEQGVQQAKSQPDPRNTPSARRFWQRKAKSPESKNGVIEDGVYYDMSFVKALFIANGAQWSVCVAIHACASILQITAPLVTRLLIREISLANAMRDAETAGLSTSDLQSPRPLYHSCGLALSLFAMLFVAGLANTHHYFRAQWIGYLMHGATIDLVGRKSMRLSGKARNTQTSGKINTLVANDAGYLEFMAPSVAFLVVQPCVVIAGIGLLIWFLGYSALVGVAILVGSTPLVGKMFSIICRFRTLQNNALDRRVRLMSEVLVKMRAIKVYAFETLVGQKVKEVRQEEIDLLRSYGVMRASINSLFDFLPIVAIVLTFITYSLTGHDLSPEIIFPALQFFNIVGAALRRLPLMISNVLDAKISFGRIGEMLVAEELVSTLHIDEQCAHAVEVQGDFQFDSVAPPDQGVKRSDAKIVLTAKKKKEKKPASRSWLKRGDKDLSSQPEESKVVADKASEEQDEKIPFSLRGIDVKIPRGALVCVVGRVGSGKTSLFLGMINEMRRLSGQVTFGGRVSLVPQHAWVKSGTIKENITFSAKADAIDEERVQEVIEATGLRPDIDMWQDAELTQIGERGITLSGGQRQRICIARAAYDDSDIVLLDDPLSAVDANVGHHLLHKCILNGPFANRTRILVTHHLDVLPKADWVIVLDRNDANEGRVIQQGTYQDLVQEEGVFQTLIQEYGSAAAVNSSSVEPEENPDAIERMTETSEGSVERPETKQKGGKLLLDEERETGEIAWKTYKHYLQAIGTWWWSLIILVSIVSVEATRTTNSLFLGFWASDHFEGLTTGAYMGIYAGLAGAIALCTWIATYTFIVAGNRASFRMFNDAWEAVMRSPSGWHDRTPTGRVISRLSKDVQMMDNRLAQTWLLLISLVLAVLGLFAMIVYTFPWLGLIFIPIGAYLYILSSYYRRTTREVKRVHSLLRSFMYNCLQEQLAGLAVIRAFSQQTRFEQLLQATVNTANRAHFLMDALEVWAACRVECIASILILALGLFGAFFRDTVDAALFGVTMAILLGSLTLLKELVPTWALCEQQMNAVERVQHYRELETEAAATLPTDPRPDENWPPTGAVSFTDVQLKYRPDLPLVLKGLTFDIKPAEKVGIIGRTGAGKSSIAQALFRTVELSGGKIEVDGRDLRELGLDVVRGRLSIIPQDAFLFSGTVRENIDPTGVRSDAELNSAMSLIHQSSSSSVALKEKFKLDRPVSDNGTNFSAGERQLLSLMRALARGCKVLLLDEATSSVDPETDALIQKVIQTEFSDVTLISIAHRLQTVAFYDRILVMDAGQIAEFDTPLNLFDRPGSIFRSLCEKKSLGRENIVRIQNEAAKAGVRSVYPSPLPSPHP